jgi:hypothetical protein
LLAQVRYLLPCSPIESFLNMESYQFAKGLTFKVGTHALIRPLRPASISDG